VLGIKFPKCAFWGTHSIMATIQFITYGLGISSRPYLSWSVSRGTSVIENKHSQEFFDILCFTRKLNFSKRWCTQEAMGGKVLALRATRPWGSPQHWKKKKKTNTSFLCVNRWINTGRGVQSHSVENKHHFTIGSKLLCCPKCNWSFYIFYQLAFYSKWCTVDYWLEFFMVTSSYILIEMHTL
jgi:hypothetical protein